MVYQKPNQSKPIKPVAVKCTPLPIVQHGNQERAAITVPLTTEFDMDLIEAISAIPNKERMEILRQALRIGLDVVKPDASLKDWLTGQLSGLHQYLEQKFSSIGTVERSVFTEVPAPTGKMTAEQRAKRLKNTGSEEY